jgi:hypothetical protein
LPTGDTSGDAEAIARDTLPIVLKSGENVSCFGMRAALVGRQWNPDVLIVSDGNGIAGQDGKTAH